MFIDADTHVDECPETWSYMPAASKHLTPGTMTFSEGEMPSYLGAGYQRAWFIDGQIYQRQVRSDERTGTTVDQRELYDVGARVKDMDELDVEVQVIYPTLFLNQVTFRPELEVALFMSYNRWLADRTSDAGGRLRWVAMIPFSSPADAIAELTFAKEHGACGVFKRGLEDDRHLADPAFHPVYAAAQDLDLPICVHNARPWRAVTDLMTSLQTGLDSAYYVQDAFNSVLRGGLTKRFPTLRIGFIEAGAGWLPYVLWSTRAMSDNALGSPEALRQAYAKNRELLAESRLFVTPEVSEDLPYLIDQVGDDNYLIGSDYGHPDRASVWGAQRLICERPDISPASADKLTRSNAQIFYGL